MSTIKTSPLNNSIAAVMAHGLGAPSLARVALADLCALATVGVSACAAVRELIKRGRKSITAYAAHLTGLALVDANAATIAYSTFWREAKGKDAVKDKAGKVTREAIKASPWRISKGAAGYTCVAAETVQPSNRAGKVSTSTPAASTDESGIAAKLNATKETLKSAKSDVTALRIENKRLTKALATVTAERDALRSQLAAAHIVPVVKSRKTRAAAPVSIAAGA